MNGWSIGEYKIVKFQLGIYLNKLLTKCTLMIFNQREFEIYKEIKNKIFNPAKAVKVNCNYKEKQIPIRKHLNIQWVLVISEVSRKISDVGVQSRTDLLH